MNPKLLKQNDFHNIKIGKRHILIHNQFIEEKSTIKKR